MSEFPITILDGDFIVTFSTKITTRPFPGRGPDFNSPGEPPEPGEFEVEIERLRVPNHHADAPDLEVPAWLHALIVDKIMEDDSVYRGVRRADRRP
jgi:hypothetical protein